MVQDFPITDSQILSSALDGNTLYIGGNFSRVWTYVGKWIGTDAATGNLDTSWPLVTGEYVVASAPDGSGGWYIGGRFSSVRGVPRMNVAHVLADGSVSPWNPGANGGSNGDVRAIAVSGTTVYIAGYFFSAGGQSRNYLAAIDATTGLATSWNPSPDNVVSALAVNGSAVYAGGFYTNIGGQSRTALAAIDAGTGLATSWNPTFSSFASVNSIAVSGTTVYVSGGFTTAGGQSRTDLAAIDTGTGLATSWNPSPNNLSNCYAVAVSGSIVYVGGAFTSIGGQSRTYLAAIDASTGLATAWNPVITGPFGNNEVHSLAVSGSLVYIGGYFTSAGGQPREGAAAIDASTGLATAWNPGGLGEVRIVATSGSEVFVGGYLNGYGGVARSQIAAIDVTTGLPTAWNPGADGSVNAIAVSGSTVYVGGDFSNIGGQARSKIAALDAATGLATSWNPGLTNLSVKALAVDGSNVYAGGLFQFIGGQLRDRIAALDATTGSATSWNPGASDGVLAIAVSGGNVYVGGAFTTAAGQPRSHIAALDASTGSATSWNPGAGDYVEAMALSGNTLYLGGDFSTAGGQVRSHIAAIDATTGSATSWNPGANASVLALKVSGSRVFVGGQFTTAGGQTRHRLASLDATTGLATDWNPDAAGDPMPSVFSLVHTLEVGGSRVYTGGSFPGINGQERNSLAAIDAADPAALSAAVISPNGGDTLHIGSHKKLEWSASGGHGVASADLYVSRSGPDGPWELITMGIPSTGTYDWVVTGPTVASNAYLRVDARDWSGSVFTDISNAAFTIGDAVASVPNRTSASFALDPLAPNPVAGVAQLSYSVPSRAHVRIRILDVTGRQVALLADGMSEPGRHSTALDARRLRAGLYFAWLTSPGVSLRQRVIVVR